MKSLKLSLLLICIFGTAHSQELSVKELTCEHRKNPIGIDAIQPRLSWKITGTGNNILHTAYSLRVATDQKFSSGKIIWQSGKTSGSESKWNGIIRIFLMSTGNHE
jgi:alpha-L-rhamnosidase